ncbi:hypothetical protein ABL78_4410 [Leptomonas seymouri]|uniref:C3H1-type domain-containing protein n=1 Tax=Leptomonas seymouri TaxID=5684 RepID=A0A0N1PD67_LEPSE|nr:hypothetical protein ABL78_4410 [Leptomonas seymouri]|eukprot:KPI86508.1 hypothetical protein ABL78_4410 [Leptomonas seymouri]
MSAPAYKEPTLAPATAARQRKAGRVNYVIEAATPAMLCLVRGAQSKVYTPLSPESIYEAVQPHDLSLRPSPYIAHQALLDFYRICDGYYGVESEDVDLQQLTVGSHSKGHHGGNAVVTGMAATSHNGASSASAPPVPSFSAAAAAAAASASAVPPLPSPDDPNISEKLNDYRIAQLRRNAQHVDNKVYHSGGANASSTAVAAAGSAGVCHFYRTRGGCHRGAQCPFAHLDKSGQPIPKTAFGAGKR